MQTRKAILPNTKREMSPADGVPAQLPGEHPGQTTDPSLRRERRRKGSRLEVAQVSKHYETREGVLDAISNVTFSVDGGEFVSLLGPSGCGKSTMLLILAGLVMPTKGEVLIDDREVKGPETDIGIVFQTPVLLDWRTALENVMLQIDVRRLDVATYRERSVELLERIGLGDVQNKYPYELSGGMQQRVAICRALVHDPSLLLMDEPFSALDALTREQLNLDLQRLWAETNKTVVFVTHSIPEAVFLSDRVVVMSPRPGVIDKIIDIDLPRPRTLKAREQKAFGASVRAIRGIFESRGLLR